MKKHIKNICCFALSILLLICLSSCHRDLSYDDEQFINGVDYGIEDTFLRIYNAVGLYNEKSLWSGDVWNTKHFSLIFTDSVIDGDKYLCFNLKLKTTTIGHCAEYDDVFFNIYAISDTEGMVLSRDNFIDYGALDYSGSMDKYYEGNSAKGTVKLLDNSDVQTMIIIIMIEGSVYTATYDI